ncbi:class I SAM-dependent methyltransferase [Variovorax sp. ZS18.2.2]|uniref:class I SAM-dependent methyltransferase n=1 Tax=Variovorax sp. ZS18.2.2 TaxID=2971255 RepID=UPI002150B657|nr:class I SAM-dependent methyltransferase [Variovorax sp. ZS18.2.2]MCR6477338.1 class I SAM-dependent methyltransferase [Variovorax sp. ZS18.2.2]
MKTTTPFGADEYLNESAMVRMAGYFDDLATGKTQVPRQSVRTRIPDRIADSEVLKYHDLVVERAGPLFTHFLASVPCILEEMSRVGVALERLVQSSHDAPKRVFGFYEVDAFDGTNGRALATYSQGKIKTLTSSPNQANQQHFDRFADPERSQFCPQSFLRIDAGVLREETSFPEFREGFDFIYETAAFQFYGQDREQQIGHVSKLLKPDGLIFFLEKLNHPDQAVYELRERAKDDLHKLHYFTPEEVAWKRNQMLTQMHNGQVEFDVLLRAIRSQFAHVYLLWNSTNFYEFVASNDADRIARFVSILGLPAIPAEFCFEADLPRKLA